MTGSAASSRSTSCSPCSRCDSKTTVGLNFAMWRVVTRVTDGWLPSQRRDESLTANLPRAALEVDGGSSSCVMARVTDDWLPSQRRLSIILTRTATCCAPCARGKLFGRARPDRRGEGIARRDGGRRRGDHRARSDGGRVGGGRVAAEGAAPQVQDRRRGGAARQGGLARRGRVGVAFGGCIVSLVNEERVQRSHTPRDEEGSFSTTCCLSRIIKMTSLLHKNVTRV